MGMYTEIIFGAGLKENTPVTYEENNDSTIYYLENE